jgi:hypothetical protein
VKDDYGLLPRKTVITTPVTDFASVLSALE